ncbi:hypothetical protein [Sulfurimonas sp. C5]|uniref:hypothetical protein n=1 Tax=Sulfurimonas sp. C5 TaxID=3036947 RepID=UPI002453DD2A|nr:hypothetical protein [Sulfurimonas sp. C5]MDH4944839.1 hypothetical protein [Sulfurimonas sp. C5]
MKSLKIAAVAMLLGSMSLFGANYGSMSTDELLDLRGTPKTQQERNELHNELQNRYKTMSQEQKQRFNSKPGKGMGQKPMPKKGGMGQGMGKCQGMKQGGMGQGQGMGKGRM